MGLGQADLGMGWALPFTRGLSVGSPFPSLGCPSPLTSLVRGVFSRETAVMSLVQHTASGSINGNHTKGNCQPKPRNKGDQQGGLGSRGWTSGGEAGKTRVGPLEGVMLVLGLDLQN